jgi:hypothetical protein
MTPVHSFHRFATLERSELPDVADLSLNWAVPCLNLVTKKSYGAGRSGCHFASDLNSLFDLSSVLRREVPCDRKIRNIMTTLPE